MKRSLVGLLLITSLTNLVYAEETPYSIDLKDMARVPLETTVQKIGDDIFVLFDDLDYFKDLSNKDKMTKKKIGDAEYVDIREFATIKDYAASYLIDGVVKPDFMPKQEWNLSGLKYSIQPKGLSTNYLNYTFNYDVNSKKQTGTLGFVSSNGSNRYLEINADYNENTLALNSASYNIFNMENNNKWVIGSSFSENGMGNSVNYFGIKMVSDHINEPNYSDSVTANFKGKLDSESVASLLINDSHYRNYKVKPGEFNFMNITNNLTSDGVAKLVLKDKNGNEKIITAPLFGAPFNLAKGKSKYGFDFGINKNPDTEKFENWFTAGNYSYGLTDKITLSTDFQASPTGRNINFGATAAYFGLSLSPVVSVGYQGNAMGITAIRTSKDNSFNFSYKKYSDYSDGANFGAYTGSTIMVGGSTKIFDLPVSASLVKQGNEYMANLGTNINLTKDIVLSLSYKHGSVYGSSVFATLNFQLGGNNQSVQYDSKQGTVATGYSNAGNRLNEINYNMNYIKHPNHQVLNGDFMYTTQYGNIGAFTSHDTSNNGTYINIGASGSVLYRDGNLNFGRYISDSILYFDTKHKGVVFQDGSGFQGKTGDNGVVYMPINSYSDFTMLVDTENTDELLLPDRTEYRGNVFPKSLYLVKPKIEVIE